MLRRTKVAVSFVLVAFSLMTGGASDANADSKLPDPIKAGVAEKLFRLDCGHSLANDESVWTPGENVGRSIEFSSTCWLIKHGSLNTNKAESIASMEKIRQIIASYKATLFINHDKKQTDKLKLLPAFYD
jgi:hypothetical protein